MAVATKARMREIISRVLAKLTADIEAERYCLGLCMRFHVEARRSILRAAVMGEVYMEEVYRIRAQVRHTQKYVMALHPPGAPYYLAGVAGPSTREGQLFRQRLLRRALRSLAPKPRAARATGTKKAPVRAKRSPRART